MAIQGTQVSMYTNTLFLYFFFLIFQFFNFFFYEKNNKAKLKIIKQKHIKQNKAMHKTRLTQNKEAKHTSNAKTIRGEREKK